MVRTVPYGLQVGQVIEPLVASEMTNGKIALAKVKYEIRVVYPGGVIIAQSGDCPGGLLKAGIPVHVEGESEPTDEELAKFVGAKTLGIETSTGVFTPVGEWDYLVVVEKRVKTPRQEAIICDILVETGREGLLEADVMRLMREQGDRLNSKQDPTHIFRYYKKHLTECGFLVPRSTSK